jgi:hypothetical protein
MTFRYSTAFIGPFCVSHARGKTGQIQKFRFPVPVPKNEDIAQGLLILDGRIEINWSTGPQYDTELGVGASLTLDQVERPLAINEEMTLTAITDCEFLCVSPIGIEQKVHLERHHLDAGDRMETNRYDLIAIAGADSTVRVNGSDLKAGPRLLYARSSELEIHADTPSTIGVFSFQG